MASTQGSSPATGAPASASSSNQTAANTKACGKKIKGRGRADKSTFLVFYTRASGKVGSTTGGANFLRTGTSIRGSGRRVGDMVGERSMI